MSNNTFQIYSDESGFPSGRFQSLAVISGQMGDIKEIREKLKEILKIEGINELKWTKLNGHSPIMKAASQIIKVILEYALQNKVRVDILYWDIIDSRHKVVGRDDLKNIGIMYYKVIKHAIRSWRLQEIK